MTKSEFFRDARDDLSGPLAGVLVVEATTTLAGPSCAATLADLGADVIKVETPQGDVTRRLPPLLPGTKVSFAHGTINRNKRSLSLYLGRPEGSEIFLKLAAKADIVVENFKTGTMDEWGVGYQAVRAVKPDIVYVSVTGWGQCGPYSNRPGYDPIAQAVSGFMSLNGSVDGPPTKDPLSIADRLGGLHGVIGAMAALHHRDRTGEGQHVDAALLDTLTHNDYLTLAAMGVNPQRNGNEFGFAVPANVFACQDGAVYLCVMLDAHWKVLARTIGHAELADDPGFETITGRVANRDACNALIASWTAERSRAEVYEILNRAGITVGPVNSYGDAARDPHVLERDSLQLTQIEDGSTVPLPGPVVKFSRTPTRVRTGAPALGQHNDEILAEIGIDRPSRLRLKESGLI
ncbi:MAG: CaiB/BaiF CoA transferase family protein [Candidatus Binataceae bacterium]